MLACILLPWQWANIIMERPYRLVQQHCSKSHTHSTFWLFIWLAFMCVCVVCGEGGQWNTHSIQRENTHFMCWLSDTHKLTYFLNRRSNNQLLSNYFCGFGVYYESTVVVVVVVFVFARVHFVYVDEVIHSVDNNRIGIFHGFIQTTQMESMKMFST